MGDTAQLPDIPYKVRNTCAICGSKLDEPVIALPDLPFTEVYVKKPVKEKVGFLDQEFHVCRKCGHGQLSYIVDPKALYDRAVYFHQTSHSNTAMLSINFFISFLDRVLKDRAFSNVVEIGCNDLYLLRRLKNRAEHLVGIDPIAPPDDGSKDGIEFIRDFVENVNLGKYFKGKSSLVVSVFTLEHIVEPRKLFKQLLESADEKSVFVLKFPGLEPLLDNLRFDQICHQHIHYFSLTSIVYLLEEFGGELIDFDINHHHWGAYVIAFKKNTGGKEWKSRLTGKFPRVTPSLVQKRFRIFKQQMKSINDQLSSLKNERIIGYGAAHGLPVLSYHLGNDLSCLECVMDDDKSKQGLYYINLPVKIKSPSSVGDFSQTTILLTAIDNAAYIIPKAVSLKPKRILLPLNIIV
jgi:hypothetical protein